LEEGEDAGGLKVGGPGTEDFDEFQLTQPKRQQNKGDEEEGEGREGGKKGKAYLIEARHSIIAHERFP